MMVDRVCKKCGELVCIYDECVCGGSFGVNKSAWQTQVGGDHYTKLAIQPMEYSMKNKLDPLQHTAIKYVTRFRDKNGVEDLYKAIDCIKMLIEYEEGPQ